MNIPFKSRLQCIVDIQERNNIFDSLSDEDKRKEIAYDLLYLILSGIVSGSCRKYWSDNLISIESSNLQIPFTTNLPRCEVCARGGMMLAQIRLGNHINSEGDCRYDGGIDNLKGFSMESFIDMESEYEYDSYCTPYKHNTTRKLANITCNVIHNGDFNTDDKTDYLTKWDINI